MSDFIVEKLTKSVGDKTVFQEISFIIHDLDRIGLIGVNGTGKTTLLDVLSGKSGFDGDVYPFSAKSDYKISYLTQEPDFDEEKTVLDTVLSSDLREMQLIREYELLMAAYDEAKQARQDNRIGTILTACGSCRLPVIYRRSSLPIRQSCLRQRGDNYGH